MSSVINAMKDMGAETVAKLSESVSTKKIREKLKVPVELAQASATISLIASVVFGALGVVAIVSGWTIIGAISLVAATLSGICSYDVQTYAKNLNQMLSEARHWQNLNTKDELVNKVAEATKGCLFLQHLIKPFLRIMIRA